MLRLHRIINVRFFTLILVVSLATACDGTKPAVGETWTLVELLTRGKRTDIVPEVVEVRNCGVAERKTVNCSAGTSNDLSVNLGGGVTFGGGVEGTISASVSSGLGLGRDSGESLALDLPPEGFIYRYTIEKTYRVLAGEVLARSSEGNEHRAPYAFHASCSIRIESREESPCTKAQAPTVTPAAKPILPADTPVSVPPPPTPVPPTDTPPLIPALTSTPTYTPVPPTSDLTGKIAYAMRDGIYVMDAEGSNRNKVYEIAGWMPVLSPDGNKIAFIRQDGLWVMDANGSGVQQIVNSDRICCAAWAPDSTQVVYTDSWAGYIVKIPGGIPEHIGGEWRYLAWSPDGVWFAGQSGQGLVKQPVSGGHTSVLDPSTGWQEGQPTWSPDGTRIAYVKGDDIFVMNADGSGQARLTDHPASDRYPHWSPDGSKIVFDTNRDGNYEIYVMNPDGSDQVNLTNSAESEWWPTWAP